MRESTEDYYTERKMREERELIEWEIEDMRAHMRESPIMWDRHKSSHLLKMYQYREYLCQRLKEYS